MIPTSRLLTVLIMEWHNTFWILVMMEPSMRFLQKPWRRTTLRTRTSPAEFPTSILSGTKSTLYSFRTVLMSVRWTMKTTASSVVWPFLEASSWSVFISTWRASSPRERSLRLYFPTPCSIFEGCQRRYFHPPLWSDHSPHERLSLLRASLRCWGGASNQEQNPFCLGFQRGPVVCLQTPDSDSP